MLPLHGHSPQMHPTLMIALKQAAEKLDFKCKFPIRVIDFIDLFAKSQAKIRR